MKVALFLLTFLLVTPSMAARFEAKNERVSDRQTKIRLCKAEGLYSYPLEHEHYINHCVQTTDFYLKGYSYSTTGELTIKHYELRQRVWSLCEIKDVLLPAGKTVVLEDGDKQKAGDIIERENTWELQVQLSPTKPACFQ